jgi:hypothetical protein
VPLLTQLAVMVRSPRLLYEPFAFMKMPNRSGPYSCARADFFFVIPNVFVRSRADSAFECCRQRPHEDM